MPHIEPRRKRQRETQSQHRPKRCLQPESCSKANLHELSHFCERHEKRKENKNEKKAKPEKNVGDEKQARIVAEAFLAQKTFIFSTRFGFGFCWLRFVHCFGSVRLCSALRLFIGIKLMSFSQAAVFVRLWLSLGMFDAELKVTLWVALAPGVGCGPLPGCCGWVYSRTTSFLATHFELIFSISMPSSRTLTQFAVQSTTWLSISNY